MADYQYKTTTGAVIPDTANVRDQVIAEYKGVFGEDLITDPATPEGRLIDAEVSSRLSVLRNNAQVANQINPQYSGGIFLDALLALTYDKRTKAQSSTVTCSVTGVPGTIIDQGSRAADSESNIWLAANDITIGIDGTASGSFESEIKGPITASPGTITTIVDDVLGWETVTNASAATAGVLTQSDPKARQQRRIKLALSGRKTSLAIQSNLASVPGYRSHSFRENIAPETVVIDGVTLGPNSVWIAVDGGTDQDIANALYESKSPGANWNGDVSVAVTDEVSGQNGFVKFFRASQVPILVEIDVRPRAGLEPTDEVIQIILDYVAGNIEGEDGFVTGREVSAFEIGAAVNSQLSNIFVKSVRVALKEQFPTFGPGPIVVSIGEIATLLSGDIEVNIV